MYPQSFGKYVIERELARGGMARVLLATLRGAGGFEKRLVVKQIRDEWAHDSEFVTRFVAEAKTTVALSHPNIVPVYELGVEQGVYFIAMELVSGVSVAELLEADRVTAGRAVGLSADEGAHVGAELCRALDYAHRRMNVVHRDLTPRNVMIDEEGQVRLIDFGIAAPARAAGHEVLGSPGHMPPEQLAGGELGPATDVFALAALLMEAWSGEAPFRRATEEACAAAMHAAHPRPSDAHPELAPLDAVVARCLRLDPRERPQEVDELGRALRSFLKERETEELARRLGERVRQARDEGASKLASSEPPSTRKLDDGEAPTITRTFAAREPEVTPSNAPATRRLDSPLPPPPAPPALPAPPVAPEGATPVSGRAPVPQRAHEPVPTGRSPLARTASVLALLAVAGAAWSVYARRESRSLPPHLSIPAATAPLDPSSDPRAPFAASPSATVISAPPSAPTPAPAPAPSPAASAATRPPPSGAARETPARAAELVLLGELGTRVSVDGTPRGRTPVRLSVEPGPHDVRFTFEATGESQGMRVSARAGEQVSLRSEFTGAVPTVRVVR
ncbi:MAG: serine/threonine protein kinase [Myxococcales bacterium]|nr:serine/threonine protein kinase [Myxococcales bacterium]MBL0195009.1 serine/threonine protein kinase [Myxococcales bacterium]